MSERQASNFRRGSFTNPHIKALEELSRANVFYIAEEVVHCWGEFDGRGRPVSYKCDIIINDPNFGSGIIEIEGEGTNSDDMTRDHRLLSTGFEWIEHVPNVEAKNVLRYLEKHRRGSDLCPQRNQTHRGRNDQF